MLLSIALILLVGMSMGWICKKIKLPSLLGMMITGMILGPYVLNLLDDSILGISAELRKIALIIILTRAGLGLDLSGLKDAIKEVAKQRNLNKNSVYQEYHSK